MRVVSAGRRFGKSNLGGHELTAEAIFTKYVAEQYLEEGKRREFWIVGPEYTDSEKEFRVLVTLEGRALADVAGAHALLIARLGPRVVRHEAPAVISVGP